MEDFDYKSFLNEERENEIEAFNDKKLMEKKRIFKRTLFVIGMLYSLFSSLFLTLYMFYRKSDFDNYIYIIPFVFVGLISVSLVFFRYLSNEQEYIFKENDEIYKNKKILDDILRNIETNKDPEREVSLKDLEKANHESFVRLTEISISNRLKSEISSIKKRSTVNLFIGISFAVFGVSYLIVNYSINGSEYLYDKGISQSQKILFILETVSVASIVQIFSLFFLRLHRNGIGEIKNFHNEMTDLELKFIAISIIPDEINVSGIYKICDLLFNSNRSIILKKGETTESILKEKFIYENDEKFQKMVMDIIKSIKEK